MSTPAQAVVRDGTVTTIAVMDAATADQYRAFGFVELLWGPGAILVDITDLDPQPGIGWGYDGRTFTAPPPPPAPEPTEPEPAAEVPVTNPTGPAPAAASTGASGGA